MQFMISRELNKNKIVSRDIDKIFYKIQHAFMLKTLNQLETKVNFINPIKVT